MAAESSLLLLLALLQHRAAWRGSSRCELPDGAECYASPVLACLMFGEGKGMSPVLAVSDAMV